MNVSIQITQSEKLQALFKRAESMPERVLEAMAEALKEAGPIIIGNAVKNRFVETPGPFPFAENKLGRKTGRLRQSLFATAPQFQEGAASVTMGFGSNVKYFKTHEFGFEGKVQVQAHARRAVATESGKKLTRAQINSKKNSILIKGANNHGFVRAHSRDVKILARAPMQTELRHARTYDVVTELAARELRKVIAEIKGGAA